MTGPDRIGVYPIVDVGEKLAVGAAPALAQAYLDGGARWIQLRAKALPAGPYLSLARTLVELTAARGARLIVNDRPDVALAAGAAGVHLGQDDLPAAEVRRWLPAQLEIGVSCHSRAQIEAALTEGVADYVALGPIFATKTKLNPDPVVGLSLLAEVVAAFPGARLVAIGGITRENIREVGWTGASGAAMIADLMGASDPRQAVREAQARFLEPRQP